MNHIDRLNKAIEYIEANLDKHIELALLAAEFALSKYHFHRIFKALIGDPPSKYIEKRRLSRAASDLVHTNKRIVDIAFEYGFNAHESFTRSFKKHYSLTPSQFRKKRPDVRIYQQSRLAAVDLKLANGRVQLNPDIIHISGLTVAGLTYSGNDKHEIYSLWQRFWGMVQEGRIRLGEDRCLGVCLHDIDMRNNETFVYFAGIEVNPSISSSRALQTIDIPASTYALFTHKGPISDIEQTYDRIYGSWIPNSGNTPTMDLDIIVVDDRFNERNSNSRVDIMIPIRG